jgi:hypothetical protein
MYCVHNLVEKLIYFSFFRQHRKKTNVLKLDQSVGVIKIEEKERKDREKN